MQVELLVVLKCADLVKGGEVDAADAKIPVLGSKNRLENPEVSLKEAIKLTMQKDKLKRLLDIVKPTFYEKKKNDKRQRN